MLRTLKSKNLIMIAIILVLLLSCSVVFAQGVFAATTGVIYNTDGEGLYMRSGPGSGYDIIDSLMEDEEIIILEKTGDWYKVDHNGIVGYAYAEYIKVDEKEDDKDYVYNEDFEQDLKNENFPDSYKEALRKLHANYPNWVFKAQHTGIKWVDAVEAESEIPINLVLSSSDDSWKSREYGALDANGNYIVFDSGGWVAASRGIIEYFMDPRNFLDDEGIFQFMSHSYDEETQTKSGLQSLVAGTFLANKFPEPGHDTYSDILIYAGKNANANPYVLASMILVEQGTTGFGGSISGTVPGFEGYYNYFNVRAYAAEGYDAVEYGLLYAKGSGEYGRPWNSRAKSIIGGALHYATSFINNDQNTLYLKKFNVMNGLDEVATHQYMTNVAGAAQEAENLKEGYGSDEAITFYIPVYKNMPSDAVEKPGSGNNDYFLKTLEVAGYDLLPKFNKYTDSYEVVVPSDTTKVSINAVPNSSTSKVKGAGNVTLTGNVTNIKITVTASSGATKDYHISVARQTLGAAKVESSVYKVGSNITGVDFNTSVSKFKSNIKVTSGYTFKVMDKNGKELTSGNVGTGTKVVVYSGSESVRNIPVVIKGDPSGDGKVTSVDVLYAKRHIVKTYNLSGEYLSASDINGDGKITSVDPLYMQRHIVQTYTIKQ